MGESPIFAQLLGQRASSPIFFTPDCERKLWAIASKQNGVIQKSKLYQRPSQNTYFRHLHMETYYVLNIT